MTLQAIKYGAALPQPMRTMIPPAYLNRTIDAAGEKVAFLVRVPKSGTISKVWFRTGAVTTSETLAITLQTVSTGDGFPTGSAYGGMTEGTQAAPAANTGYTVSLGTGATATVGDWIAIVIEFDSAVGNLEIATVQSPGGHLALRPTVARDIGGWAFLSGNHQPVCALEYNDGSYEPLSAYPFSALANVDFASNTTPDEIALKFTLPFPATAAGFWMASGGSGAFDVVLYEGTTAKLTRSIDPDQLDYSGGGGIVEDWWDTGYDTVASTAYYLAVKPTTTTTTRIYTHDVSAAAIMDSLPGGQVIHYAERTDAGAWSATTTKRPFFGLMFTKFGDDAGAGGGGIRLAGTGGLAS